MIWSGFLIGIIGSLHCLVMCGPLVMAAQKKEFIKNTSSGIIYHSGRLLAYVFIGLLFGLVSKAISLFIFQQYLSILAGVLLILITFSHYVNINKFQILPGYNISSWLYRSSTFKSSLIASFMLGLSNGFLPCGLVYVAAISGLQFINPIETIFYMFLFGFGTFPIFILLHIGNKILFKRISFNFSILTNGVTLTLALLLILRGLNLNIPYVSPGVSEANHTIKNCCSSK